MKKTILLFAMVFCLGVAGYAQHGLHGIIKASYDTKDPSMLISDIQHDVDDGAVNFIKKCNAELGLRYQTRLGLYIETGIAVSVNSVWDSVVSQSGSFWERAKNTFTYTQGLQFTLPVYAGWNFPIGDANDLAFRVYVGPEFYSTVGDLKEFKLNFNTYSLAAGVGVDLFNGISLDAKATYFMASQKGLTAIEKNELFYTISIGFLL